MNFSHLLGMHPHLMHRKCVTTWNRRANWKHDEQWSSKRFCGFNLFPMKYKKIFWHSRPYPLKIENIDPTQLPSRGSTQPMDNSAAGKYHRCEMTHTQCNWLTKKHAHCEMLQVMVMSRRLSLYCSLYYEVYCSLYCVTESLLLEWQDLTTAWSFYQFYSFIILVVKLRCILSVISFCC